MNAIQSEVFHSLTEQAATAVSLVQLRSQMLDDLKSTARELFAPHRCKVLLSRKPSHGVVLDPLFRAASDVFRGQSTPAMPRYAIGAALSCYNDQVEERAVAVLLWEDLTAALRGQVLGSPRFHDIAKVDAEHFDETALSAFLKELLLYSFGVGASTSVTERELAYQKELVNSPSLAD